MRRPMVAPGPARLRGVGHFAAPTLAISRARVSRLNAFGLEFSNVGKNGHSARFAWNGED